MSIKKNVEALNSMILNGQILEAFDKYYAENVEMQENNEPPRVGKAINRQHEIDFLNNVAEFHGAEVLNVAVGDQSTMVEWFMDVTFKEGGRTELRQVSVQTWDNDQITKEKFYYGT
ncbi:MAG: nuclear transport factor 2 family protein [Cyclobacteriaceae bacterium]|jgi:hypothetical protein